MISLREKIKWDIRLNIERSVIKQVNSQAIGLVLDEAYDRIRLLSNWHVRWAIFKYVEGLAIASKE